MKINTINLKKRLLERQFLSEQKEFIIFIDTLVNELNQAINKGVVLKQYGLLNKGERWKRKDLDSFLSMYEYMSQEDDNVKYTYYPVSDIDDIDLSNIKGNKNNKGVNCITNSCLKDGDYFEIIQRFRATRELIDYNGALHRRCQSLDDENDTLAVRIGFEKITPVGSYNKEKKVKNRRELLKTFYQILPLIADRLLQIEYYKLPDYKALYKKQKMFNSAKSYEHAHRYGERRIMKGNFIIEDFSFKERDGYLLMNDIEDNNIEKPVIIRNIISFIFNGVKYYYNDRSTN